MLSTIFECQDVQHTGSATQSSASLTAVSPPPDCLLGPAEEEHKKDAEGDGPAQKNLPHIPIHSHPNAFHVWDQDEVIIPMLMHLEESPPISPMLAGLPYMPSFFPSTVHITSPPYAHHIRRESEA